MCESATDVSVNYLLYEQTANRGKVTRWTWVTNIPLNARWVESVMRAGRSRWKIENEGLNTKKNLGYGLEHKYSRDSFPAMQNYYQTMQIAHMVNQLVERTKAVLEIIREHSKQTIDDLWKKLIAYLTLICYNEQIKAPYQPR